MGMKCVGDYVLCNTILFIHVVSVESYQIFTRNVHDVTIAALGVNTRDPTIRADLDKSEVRRSFRTSEIRLNKLHLFGSIEGKRHTFMIVGVVGNVSLA
mmetsp:Transcript_3598/g.7724  ORF Transcript_3598/g.7724 Transcript_3598/m.7724 type:complete len:99 (+) Transcript_3598:280-576(+)